MPCPFYHFDLWAGKAKDDTRPHLLDTCRHSSPKEDGWESRTRSKFGNLLALPHSPSPTVLAKFLVCRSYIIVTIRRDETQRCHWNHQARWTGASETENCLWVGSQEGGSWIWRLEKQRTGGGEVLMMPRASEGIWIEPRQS